VFSLFFFPRYAYSSCPRRARKSLCCCFRFSLFSFLPGQQENDASPGRDDRLFIFFSSVTPKDYHSICISCRPSPLLLLWILFPFCRDHGPKHASLLFPFSRDDGMTKICLRPIFSDDDTPKLIEYPSLRD